MNPGRPLEVISESPKSRQCAARLHRLRAPRSAAIPRPARYRIPLSPERERETRERGEREASVAQCALIGQCPAFSALAMFLRIHPPRVGGNGSGGISPVFSIARVPFSLALYARTNSLSLSFSPPLSRIRRFDERTTPCARARGRLSTLGGGVSKRANERRERDWSTAAAHSAIGQTACESGKKRERERGTGK